jgi:2-polyprenyl-3-methyl-5-hydroxy-6-metoxy-1,4-benzoquinol methylase
MRLDLSHPDASIVIDEVMGRHRIRVNPKNGLFTPIRDCETGYSLELIKHVLAVKGPSYLCDEIKRDEDVRYLQHCLYWDTLGFLDDKAFVGRRILDFGSGSGASSMVLSRLFPESQICGVELVPDYLNLARHRADFYQVQSRVSFQLSPSSNALPPDIGTFDFVIFSAVFEHLLPEERRKILPLLWTHLKQGGVLFLDQTPYRWSPIEMHTTGLPLINYLPDSLTLHAARLFSKRIGREATWNQLLRKGIRGATEHEILSILKANDAKSELIRPTRLSVKDELDLWLKLSQYTRNSTTAKFIAFALRTFKTLTGISIVPTLSLAIRKLH